jgi:hypothetical protein
MKTVVTITAVITLIVIIIASILVFVVWEHEKSTLIEEITLLINKEHGVKATNYSILLIDTVPGTNATLNVYKDKSLIRTKTINLKDSWKVDSIKIVLIACDSQSASVKIYTAE